MCVLKERMRFARVPTIDIMAFSLFFVGIGRVVAVAGLKF